MVSSFLKQSSIILPEQKTHHFNQSHLERTHVISTGAKRSGETPVFVQFNRKP